MNNKLNQQSLKDAIKPRFKNSKTLKSRYVPRYPDTAERELKRLTYSCVRIMRDTLKEHLPIIMREYRQCIQTDARFDDAKMSKHRIDSEFQKMYDEIEKKIISFGVAKFLDRISSIAGALTVREWKRLVRSTLGIDLRDDFYKGDEYAQLLKQWVDKNVNEITTIPKNSLGKMKEIIHDGYVNGRTVSTIQKEIQKEYGTTRSYAAMLARDQISTLNSQITQKQHRNAGVEQYIWSDSHDSRVRECHRALNGNIFDWNKPPEMWYMTKSKGKVMTGRKCHPGEDYCCRCVALPYFNIESLDFPFESARKK